LDCVLDVRVIESPRRTQTTTKPITVRIDFARRCFENRFCRTIGIATVLHEVFFQEWYARTTKTDQCILALQQRVEIGWTGSTRTCIWPKGCSYFDFCQVRCFSHVSDTPLLRKPGQCHSNRAARAWLEPGAACRTLPVSSHVHRFGRKRRTQSLDRKPRANCRRVEYALVDAHPSG
jgi:hypothetical protein